MKEVELYSRGYLIRVTTWENDGDNYQTEEISGFDWDEVEFIVKFLDLFDWVKGEFGNLVEGEEKILREAIDRFKSEHEWVTYLCEDDIMRGFGIKGGEIYITRVVEKVEIFYLPEKVIAEVIEL